MDLNILARTLAERLTLDVAELPDRTSPDDWPEAMLITDSELRQMAEAVIREAIDKTLEEAEQSITRMLTDPRPYPFSQHVELAIKACASEVKLLKQSNSGMEVGK